MKCASFIGCALGLVLGGCVTSDSIRPQDGRSFQVTDRSYQQVWNAGILTVGSLGSIESQDRSRGEIRGFREASAWSNGNALGVFINPPNDAARSFTVSVVGAKFSTLQITGTDFAATMESMMKARLEQ
jgi:hypothetical protein